MGFVCADAPNSESLCPRAVVERGLLEAYNMAYELAGSEPLGLASDGTSTYYQVSFLTVSLCSDSRLHFGGILDTWNGKTAAHMLTLVTDWMADLRKRQTMLGIHPLRQLYLHRIAEFASDNESANTGKVGGFLALLNKARREELKLLVEAEEKADAPPADQCDEPTFAQRNEELEDVRFLSCHVHVANILASRLSAQMRAVDEELGIKANLERGQKLKQSRAHFFVQQWWKATRYCKVYEAWFKQHHLDDANRRKVTPIRFYSAEFAAWRIMQNWSAHVSFAADLKHSIGSWSSRVYEWLSRDADHLLFCFDLLYINLSSVSLPLSSSAANAELAEHHEFVSDLFEVHSRCLIDRRFRIRQYRKHLARARQQRALFAQTTEHRREHLDGARANSIAERKALKQAQDAVPLPDTSAWQPTDAEDKMILAWSRAVVATFEAHCSHIVHAAAGAEPAVSITGLRYDNISCERNLSLCKHILDHCSQIRVLLIHFIMLVMHGKLKLASLSSSPLGKFLTPAMLRAEARKQIGSAFTRKDKEAARLEQLQADEAAKKEAKRQQELQKQKLLDELKARRRSHPSSERRQTSGA